MRSRRKAPQAVFEAGVPVLGICYGMQTMAQQLGGRVSGSDHREFGYAQVTVTAPCRLFNELFDHRDPQGRAVLDVWMSHGDRVEELPAGFVPVGSSPNAPLAAMADETRQYYAVQFHPEVTHTLQGGRMLERFVREICALRGALGAGQHHRRRGRARARAGRQRQGAARACPAASIRRSWRRCCIARSATSWSACSSTTACCAPTKATRS